MRAPRPATKPAKQRKRVFQAPDHIRHKLFAAPLSSELKASQGVKTLPVRSGDTVRIVRGDHKGFEGKISRVDRRKYRIYVEGLTREKVDGTAIFVPVHPSKVMITNLALDDKWRKKVIERKREARKKAIEVAEKPAKKVEEVKEVKEEAVAEKVIVKEKLKAKKPRAPKKRVVKKAPIEKAEKEKAEVEVEEKPKTKKTRAKRKTTKKDEGGA
jgi:large subunit ribosomal protein L24